MDSSQVFAPGSGVPAWADSNVWLVQLDKLPKLELKVYMCCKKCEEIVEEIREVKGVVSVKIDRPASKVTVIGHPDSSSVLKKARKVDKKAIILVPQKEKSKENTEKKVEETASSSVYQHNQAYPPRYYPGYPETYYVQCPYANPHYLKHVHF